MKQLVILGGDGRHDDGQPHEPQAAARLVDQYRLFPKGPGKLAARLAGLPKPQSCV